MSFSIAITGKGGTGKTTVAALIVKQLIAHGCKPVLAVDADPNSCLDAALGVSVTETLGHAREETKELSSKGVVTSVSKHDLLEMKIAKCLVETDNFDFISMGRPEGPGCYCYANNVLRDVLTRVSSQYPFVVLDNEAGLENLSRRIIQKVDLLIFMADPSRQGLFTIRRLYDLAHEMRIQYSRLAIIVNRLMRNTLPKEIDSLKAETNADIVIGIPEDTAVAELGRNEDALWSIPPVNPAVKTLDEFLRKAGVLQAMESPGL